MAATDIATLGLEVRVNGLEQAVAGLQNLTRTGRQAEEQSGALAQGLDRLGYSLGSLEKLAMQTAAALGLVKLMDMAKEATLLAARYETLGVVMTTIGKTGGYTNSQMAGFQSALQATGISAISARQSLALMGQAQIDFANSSKLARIAQDAAVVGNVNSSEAFQRMMTGLATGQTIILHHLGLMTNFEEAYLKAAHAANKTTKDLTETEKAQIRVNEVIRAGAGIAGAYEAAMGTVGKQLTSLPRYFQDLAVQVGSISQGVLFEAVSGLTNALKWLSKNFDDVTIAASTVAGALAGMALASIITNFTLFATAVESVGAAFVTMTAAMSANPIGAIASLLSTATFAWIGYMKAAGDALEKQDKAGGSYFDKLAAQNVEIREQIRLHGLSEKQKAESKAAAHQEEMNRLKKEEVTLSAQILAIGLAMQGGDYYDLDKLDALQSKLNKINMDLANGLAIARGNADLLEKQAKLKAKSTKPDTAPDDSSGNYAQELRRSEQEYQAYLESMRQRKMAAEKHDLDSEIAYLKQANAEKLLSDREMIANQQAAQLESEKKTEASLTHKYLLAVQYANYQEALLAKTRQQDDTYTGDTTGYHTANKAEENARKEMESAAAKVKAAQDLIKLTGTQGREADKQAEIQNKILLLQAQGNTVESTKLQNEIKYADMLKKDDSLFGQRLVAQQKETDAVTAHSAEYAKQLAIRNELNALDEANAAASAAMTGTNASGGFDSIADQTANALAIQENAHEAKLRMIQKEYEAQGEAWRNSKIDFEDYLNEIASLDEKVSLEERSNKQKTTKIAEDGFKAQLSAAAQYTGMAGQMFTALASTQDQSSRSGFESAKAFNMAAAVMSTAAAVMNAMATVPWPMSLAAAALAAATGAVQIATISATSFGGGASAPNVPSGSISGGSSTMSGGSVGSSIGSPLKSNAESQTQASLQTLAASAENASVVIGRMSDTMASISSLFAGGGSLSMVGGAMRSNALAEGSSKGFGSVIGEAFTGHVGQTLVDFFKSGNFAAAVKDMTISVGLNGILPGLGAFASSILGGSQSITGSGSALRIDAGKVGAFNYADVKTSGGWFGSDKTKTTYIENEKMAALFQTYVDKLFSSITRMAVTLGTTSNVEGTQLAPFKLSTAGRTKEDINKDLEEWFTKAGAAAAETVAGLKDFAFYGETYYDTLVRLNDALVSTNDMFSLVTGTLVDGKLKGTAAIESTLKGGDQAYWLQDAFGGAKAFTSAFEGYFSSVFTNADQEARKAAASQQQVTNAFKEMNIAAPTTRQGFIDIVNQYIAMGEAGSGMLVDLMAVAPAFGAVQDAADKASEHLKAIADATDDLNVRMMKATGQDTAAMEQSLAAQREINQAIADEMGDVYIAKLKRVLEFEAQAAADDRLKNTLGLRATEASLTGDTGAAYEILQEQRALELKKLSATDAAIQKHIWALQDQAAATQAAAKAAADAANSMNNSGNTFLKLYQSIFKYDYFANQTRDQAIAFNQLYAAMGGIEKAAATLGSYLNNFAYQLTGTSSELGKTFALVVQGLWDEMRVKVAGIDPTNIGNPGSTSLTSGNSAGQTFDLSTRAGFVTWVQAFHDLGQYANEAAALNLQDIFAKWYDAMDKAKANTQNLLLTEAQLMKDKEKEAMIVAEQRAALLEGMSKSDAAIQSHIWALQDEAKAAEDAAAAMAKLRDDVITYYGAMIEVQQANLAAGGYNLTYEQRRQYNEDILKLQKLQHQMELDKLDQNSDIYRATAELYALQEAAAYKAYLMAEADYAMQILQKAVDAKKKAAQEEYDEVVRNINLQKDAYEKNYANEEKAATDHVSAMQKVSDSFKSAFEGLTKIGDDPLIGRQAAQSLLHSFVVAGTLPMKGELDGALKTLQQPSEGMFSTLVDYKRDFAQTANDLSIMNDRAKGQLTTAEETLKALQDNHTSMETWFNSQLTEAKRNYDAQIAYYDAIITSAQAQLDALNGIAVAEMSIADALQNFGNALGALGSYGWTPGSSGTYLMPGTDPSNPANWAHYANGGITSGMSIAGENGPEAIIPLPDGRTVPVRITGAADNKEVVAELKALRSEQRAQAAEIAKWNQKTAKIIDKWDGDGMPATSDGLSILAA